LSTTTLIGYRTRMDDTDPLVHLLDVGQRLADAYTQLDTARDNARQAALTGAAAGIAEARIAAALGVDRSTVRKWLGK
jgi:hypothetical protein